MDTAVDLSDVDVVIGGKRILSDVSAKIPRGRIIGLLGPSGAGKTTLMRVIMGLQRMSAGSAEVLGHPAGAPYLRSQIGYVTQSPAIYDDLTVHENLRYFAAMLGVPKERARKAMDGVGLGPLAGHLAKTLSGGERARVSLAVALLDKPPLLVMDEPTVELDPVLRHDLWQHFRELAETGSTLLVSSHAMDEADKCDDLILLRDGRVLARGTPDQLTAHTRTNSIEGAFLYLVKEKERAP